MNASTSYVGKILKPKFFILAITFILYLFLGFIQIQEFKRTMRVGGTCGRRRTPSRAAVCTSRWRALPSFNFYNPIRSIFIFFLILKCAFTCTAHNCLGVSHSARDDRSLAAGRRRGAGRRRAAARTGRSRAHPDVVDIQPITPYISFSDTILTFS